MEGRITRPLLHTPADTALADLPQRKNAYPPIRDFALIGDTLTAAIVARDGAIEFLCLPDFDGDAVFTGMLDARRGGRFFVGPTVQGEITRDYIGDSAVLRTTHHTPQGVLQVTDLMPMGERADGSIGGDRQVLRIVEALEGAPELAVLINPMLDWGATLPDLRQDEDGSWRMEFGHDGLRFVSDVDLSPVAPGALGGSCTLQAGETRFALLTSASPDARPVDAGTPRRELDRTLAYWKKINTGCKPEGPFRKAIMRSAVTLHLLHYNNSGALLAAPTAGLPETIGGVRNYDYRFCWIRDATFVLHAFFALNLPDCAQNFFRWLMQAARQSAPRLGVFYSIGKEHDPGTRTLTALEGYRGSAPLIIGNDAQGQLQLDGYGAVLDCARMYVRHGGTLSEEEQTRLQGYAQAAMLDWTLPDNGLWEIPGSRQHHTYSKAMCWQALDAWLDLIELGAVKDDPEAYRSEHARIRDYVLSRAWSEEVGAFTGAIGRDWLDASVLLLPRIGIVAPDDPKMVATYQTLKRELSQGPHFRRYQEGVDGIAGNEGHFMACGFWAADYLTRAGRITEAEAQISGLLATANDLGLMPEEIDPASGDHLGNFPQAFSHAGLIAAAVALEEARGTRADCD
ncbi:glycoside hydrolase family 15 protein [Thioclava sp. GXIMD4215]|uniref:glycoside hydrolase family 15 protein n=1 Tax=Thioclava sp. GXIMD4215 TaxID=3131928 RepID=UPI0032542E10